MIRILLPDNSQRRLVFYLAMEEYLAKRPSGDDMMFFWNVPPTVIFGRNQVMSAEVNVAWCREHNILMYRRKSGGGCVYSDEGNLMISCISSYTDVNSAFGAYLNNLARALRGLGVPAEVSGRNDIMIEGRKLSGNAFQLFQDRSIVHGTLLFDSDFDALIQAITPSESKLDSKGVSSVRQRVVNLRECLGEVAEAKGVDDIPSLIDYLAGELCDAVETLTEDDVLAISEIERTYLDPDFIAGNEPVNTLRRIGRIDSVGEVCVELCVKLGLIDSVHLSGDYFALKTPDEIDALLSRALCGIPLQYNSLLKALADCDIESAIPSLSPCYLAELVDSGAVE